MQRPENVAREFAEKDRPAFLGDEHEKAHRGSRNSGDLGNEIPKCRCVSSRQKNIHKQSPV